MSEVRLRQEELKWRELAGELVAVDVRTSTYLTTNHTGMTLWAALAEGTCRQELVARLMTAYDIDHGRAAADVDALLEDLRSRDLLEG